MTPAEYERVRTIFLAVREKNPAEREEFVRSACGGDQALLREVESLLANDQAADSFLATPALGADFGLQSLDALAGSGPRMPEQVGGYRILGVLGQGGMGIVYHAEQDSPRRPVALKVLRPDLHSPDVHKRFASEGQLLGRLQHPGIAQVYQAGAADSGRGPQPFFVMEYIQGRPLTEYARAHELGLRQRLELLAKVCDAVHYAHEMGVIHRDLKPANILVDETGQPKILDFGVAHVTDSDRRATTLCTAAGQLVGTLAYMSPEQVSDDPKQLDGRSDVYALGVLGYELLTGRVPFDLASQSLPQATRIIVEQDPPTPGSVNRLLGGDVETILLKALEKDRERRYASAADLAADIRRHLADQPILARPVTTFYQLRKFAKRNKPLVAGVVVAFVALVAGIAGTTTQAVRATRARNRAVAAERLAARNLDEAQRQAAIAQAVNEFLNNDLLAAANPQRLGREVTVREVLDLASANLGNRFQDEPLVEAAIRATLGETYHYLGDYKAAQLHFARALELRRQAYGEDHPETLIAMSDLGIIYQYTGRWAEAEELLRRSLAGQRRHFADDHPQLVRTLNSLGTLLFQAARYAEAEPVFSEALERARRLGEPGQVDRLDVQNNLANLYATTGRYERAAELYSETLAVRRRLLGEEHPRTLVCLNNVANVHYSLERYQEAESAYRQVFQIRRRTLGEEHPRTLNVAISLSLACQRLGRQDEARTLGEQTLETARRVLGPDHAQTLAVMSNLGGMYAEQGHYDRAEALLVEALPKLRATVGDRHPDTLAGLESLGDLHYRCGRLNEAADTYRAALEGRRAVLGDDHPKTLRVLAALAEVLLTQRAFDQAEPLALECYQRRLAGQGPTAKTTLESIRLLARLYEEWARPDQAAAWRAKLPTTQPGESR
jgi:tetratricopeptide (TPR) repeat protein/predicted Ser/Thr protein kinase